MASAIEHLSRLISPEAAQLREGYELHPAWRLPRKKATTITESGVGLDVATGFLLGEISLCLKCLIIIRAVHEKNVCKRVPHLHSKTARERADEV